MRGSAKPEAIEVVLIKEKYLGSRTVEIGLARSRTKEINMSARA